MAVPDAVRRSRSLLFRALAVGGLATAAWLACGGVASAEEDHSDEIGTALDAANVAHAEQQAAGAELLPGVVPQHEAAAAAFWGQPLPVDSGPTAFDPGVFEPGVFEPGAFDLGVLQPTAFQADVFHADVPQLDALQTDAFQTDAFGAGAFQAAVEHASLAVPQQADDPYAAEDDPYAASDWDDTGYSYSGYRHSGSVSNTMPAPLYEAKVAAKAAARAAASAALAPPAPTVAAPVVEPTAPVVEQVPQPAVVLASPVLQAASHHEVTWQAPQPGSPAPAPQQAPAPGSPTASSSGADSGGGHRGGGGVTASFTSQSGMEPSAAWSIERRDDWRSPGSVPGLPSTSPD